MKISNIFNIHFVLALPPVKGLQSNTCYFEDVLKTTIVQNFPAATGFSRAELISISTHLGPRHNLL